MAKKKKSAEIIVTTFEIAKELSEITEKIISQSGELLEGDLEKLQSWNAQIEIKAENIGHVKTRLESEMEYYKAIEEKARSLWKSRELSIERLKKYLAQCMGMAGIKSIKKEGGLFSISLCDGRTQCQIDDVNKLPLEYVKMVEVCDPLKAEIKKALEEGKTVDGAHLETGEPYLMIR